MINPYLFLSQSPSQQLRSFPVKRNFTELEINLYHKTAIQARHSPAEPGRRLPKLVEGLKDRGGE
jgi:hypothetical protein